MMNSREMRFSIFTFFSFILISVYAPPCIGDVLVEDDFEANKIDKGKWMPTGTWSVDDGALTLTAEKWGLLSRITLLTLSFLSTSI